MESKHFLGKVALKALLIKDGKVLITKDEMPQWELPGGRLHEGEDIEAALKRELMEELGVAVRVERLVYTEQYYQTRDGSLHLLLAYEVRAVDDSAPFTPSPREVHEMRWISREEIDQYPIYTNCLHALQAYFN